ncbi:MAG: ribosome maturation factor RimP [Frankiaceae bacterium]|jgi:ribosome maturation factor RimP|nr:ribosome maturation factor RimP [Frankiaceae bacterium]
MSGAHASRVREVVEPALSAAGFDVEDVAVRAAGRRQLVQIAVDRDGGVSLDDVADATKVVSTALDEADPFAGAYVLEVTSRGVDRPLTLPRHWRRNVGRLVAVRRSDGTVVSGRLTGADDDGATVDGVPLPYADVAKATVEIEFSRGGDDE